MKLLGFYIGRTEKAAVPTSSQPNGGTIVGDRGNWWWNIIREPFTGAWQKNMELKVDTALIYSTVYACITLIASDVSKIALRVVQEKLPGIWDPVTVEPYSAVLARPNRYQTRLKFIESWVLSKLIQGNTYVLKERDATGKVIALYVLDPCRVKVIVASDGAVYYELNTDNLAGIVDRVTVPASEIIHDRAVCLYHPLCGVSPLTACALAAVQAMSIQQNSRKFFSNGSQPGGVISAPENIPAEAAARIKAYWEANYTGDNVGKVAVLGDGLTFTPMNVTYADSQLIEQLKWTSETVCSVFHVPPYMVGVGSPPSLTNIQALNQQYYSQALQVIIEGIEVLLDYGLGMKDENEATKNLGTEFDLDDLLRMDSKTKAETWKELIGAGIASPDEARLRFNLSPVPGGDTPYLQQQNYSLAALAKRDAKPDPFASATKPTASSKPPATSEDDDEEVAEEEEKYTEANRAQLRLEFRSLINAGLMQ